jgi:hypothetical protein
MSPRGDTALFQGAAVGFGIGFIVWIILAAVPSWQTAFAPLAAISPHVGGLIAGCVWTYRVWKRGEAADRRMRGLCVECGYDLTGNVSGVCPECGTPTTHAPPGAIPSPSALSARSAVSAAIDNRQSPIDNPSSEPALLAKEFGGVELFDQDLGRAEWAAGG